MIESSYLTNQFLIAMPALADPNFSQTVTYIGEHNAQGALGLVINRPLALTLGELLEHLQMTANQPGIAALPIYHGGPVQPEQGFVLHRPLGHWGATLPVTDQIGVTTSRDILQAVADGEGPKQLLVALGYAGWGPGQLERELAENLWLSVPADPDILFQVPSKQRWQAAAALLPALTCDCCLPMPATPESDAPSAGVPTSINGSSIVPYCLGASILVGCGSGSPLVKP